MPLQEANFRGAYSRSYSGTHSNALGFQKKIFFSNQATLSSNSFSIDLEATSILSRVVTY